MLRSAVTHGIVVLLLAGCFSAPTPPRSAPPPAVEASAAIRAIEEVEWARAVRAKDTAWFQRHLAEELVLTTGRTGKVTSKAEEMADLLAPASGPADDGDPDRIEDLQIQSHGHIGIATFRLVTSGRDSSGTYHRNARYTEVWLYRDGRWQLTASHSSLIPATSTGR